MLSVQGDAGRQLSGRTLNFDCTPAGRFLGLDINGQRVSFSENVFYEYVAGAPNSVRHSRWQRNPPASASKKPTPAPISIGRQATLRIDKRARKQQHRYQLLFVSLSNTS